MAITGASKLSVFLCPISHTTSLAHHHSTPAVNFEHARWRVSRQSRVRQRGIDREARTHRRSKFAGIFPTQTHIELARVLMGTAVLKKFHMIGVLMPSGNEKFCNSEFCANLVKIVELRRAEMRLLMQGTARAKSQDASTEI